MSCSEHMVWKLIHSLVKNWISGITICHSFKFFVQCTLEMLNLGTHRITSLICPIEEFSSHPSRRTATQSPLSKSPSQQLSKSPPPLAAPPSEAPCSLFITTLVHWEESHAREREKESLHIFDVTVFLKLKGTLNFSYTHFLPKTHCF